MQRGKKRLKWNWCPPKIGDTLVPSHDSDSPLGETSTKTKWTPCESPSSAFSTLQLPLAINKFLFHLHFPATVFSAKRQGVWLKKHHVLFTGSQRQVSDSRQEGRMLNHIPLTHKQFHNGTSLLNKRITAHCHTCKDTQKEVFWFSSTLDTLFGGLSESTNSEEVRNQG